MWDASDRDLAAATTLWERLQTLPGVGPVIAGKALARKRPALVPIADNVTLRLFAAPKGELWATLGLVLANADTRSAVENVRGDVPSTVTTLRLLDTALWMTGSGSRNAEHVRERVFGQ